MARLVGVRNGARPRVARSGPAPDARVAVASRARAQRNHCRWLARIGSHRRAEGRCIRGAASPDRARLGCRGVSRPRAAARVLAPGVSMNPEQYCHRVAGVVGLMSAEIFGYDHPDTRVYARDLGIAFQLTNILRDVGEDARRGRIYLPQDDLARFEVAPSSLLGGKGSDAFRRLMAFEAVRTRAWYARALAKLDPRDRRSQRAGLIMAAIYRTLLDEIAHDGFNVLDRRTSLTPLRKLWIAWKTARKSA